MIVIDASVAFKWLRSDDEKFHNVAALLLREHIEGKNEIIVPNFLYVEVANALATKTNITQAKMKEDLEFLFETRLKIYGLVDSDITLAAKMAKKYKTSVYDMLYAVVAKKNKCILYTADENFVKKTGMRFVKHISEVGLN